MHGLLAMSSTFSLLEVHHLLFLFLLEFFLGFEQPTYEVLEGSTFTIKVVVISGNTDRNGVDVLISTVDGNATGESDILAM